MVRDATHISQKKKKSDYPTCNLPILRFTFTLRRVVRKGCAQTSAQGIMENSHAHNGEDHRPTTDDWQERKSIAKQIRIHERMKV